MDRYEEQAAEMLPCDDLCDGLDDNPHRPSCAASFRPAVAAALRAAVEGKQPFKKGGSVFGMILAQLVTGGFDGLYNGNGCACGVDDLMPCDSESIQNCMAGYKVPCDPGSCDNDGDCDFHIVPQKPAAIRKGEAT